MVWSSFLGTGVTERNKKSTVAKVSRLRLPLRFSVIVPSNHCPEKLFKSFGVNCWYWASTYRYGLLNRWVKRVSAIEREWRAWSAAYPLLFERDWRRLSLKNILQSSNHFRIEGDRLRSTLFFLFLLLIYVSTIGLAVHIQGRRR